MSDRSNRLGDLPSRAGAPVVLGLGDRLEVIGPNAQPPTAQVIDVKTGRDRTHELLVGDPVRVLGAGRVDAEAAVAIRVTGPSPLPAANKRELSVELREEPSTSFPCPVRVPVFPGPRSLGRKT